MLWYNHGMKIGVLSYRFDYYPIDGTFYKLGRVFPVMNLIATKGGLLIAMAELFLPLTNNQFDDFELNKVDILHFSKSGMDPLGLSF